MDNGLNLEQKKQKTNEPLTWGRLLQLTRGAHQRREGGRLRKVVVGRGYENEGGYTNQINQTTHLGERLTTEKKNQLRGD
jgi:hypothetical protein